MKCAHCEKEGISLLRVLPAIVFGAQVECNKCRCYSEASPLYTIFALVWVAFLWGTFVLQSAFSSFNSSLLYFGSLILVLAVYVCALVAIPLAKGKTKRYYSLKVAFIFIFLSIYVWSVFVG